MNPQRRNLEEVNVLYVEVVVLVAYKECEALGTQQLHCNLVSLCALLVGNHTTRCFQA